MTNDTPTEFLFVTVTYILPILPIPPIQQSVSISPAHITRLSQFLAARLPRHYLRSAQAPLPAGDGPGPDGVHPGLRRALAQVQARGREARGGHRRLRLPGRR